MTTFLILTIVAIVFAFVYEGINSNIYGKVISESKEITEFLERTDLFLLDEDILMTNDMMYDGYVSMDIFPNVRWKYYFSCSGRCVRINRFSQLHKDIKAVYKRPVEKNN